MANPFTKAWKYLMALFSSKVDEYADPKVQIQQAIEDAQRQHQALSQQAAAVIGNQRQLEMKLNRQLGEIEKLQASARQALVLADRQRASGDEAGAQRYEETAQVYASQLVTAEQSVEDLKTLHDQSIQAAARATGRSGGSGTAAGGPPRSGVSDPASRRSVWRRPIGRRGTAASPASA